MLRKRKAKQNFVNAFLVGCDPELVAVNTVGNVVPVNGLMSQGGEVGWDHNGRVMELRPEPSKGTYTLVKRIQSLLVDHDKLEAVRKYKWLSGAYVAGESLGGHVWIDLNPNNPLQRARIDALDNFVQCLEHLDILPNVDCKTRRKGRYGKFGDVRVHNGERPRFEYRTMPSWLYSPRVAFTALTGAKLCCYAPEEALATIKSSWVSLNRFFDKFSKDDLNARRFMENVSPEGLKMMQAISPANNVQSSWEDELDF